jgi:hypothetical protein
LGDEIGTISILKIHVGEPICAAKIQSMLRPARSPKGHSAKLILNGKFGDFSAELLIRVQPSTWKRIVKGFGQR